PPEVKQRERRRVAVQGDDETHRRLVAARRGPGNGTRRILIQPGAEIPHRQDTRSVDGRFLGVPNPAAASKPAHFMPLRILPKSIGHHHVPVSFATRRAVLVLTSYPFMFPRFDNTRLAGAAGRRERAGGLLSVGSPHGNAGDDPS